MIKNVIIIKTKAIISVHLYGYPADMDEIMSIATANDLFVVEECSQTHEDRYKG